MGPAVGQAAPAAVLGLARPRLKSTDSHLHAQAPGVWGLVMVTSPGTGGYGGARPWEVVARWPSRTEPGESGVELFFLTNQFPVPERTAMSDSTFFNLL